MKPNLNFRIMGQGTPVIILHGLFGMLDNWLTFAKRLESEGYMPILLDQRDHGRSEHTNNFNYNLLADDLYRFMEENWIHEAILIGHSMGGKTALKFVSDHESMIKKLVIVDIGIKKYPGGHIEVLNALLSVDTDSLNSRIDAENQLFEILKDHGTVQFLMKNLSRSKNGGFEWKMNLKLLHKKYHDILNEISFSHSVQTKTLFIKGGKSDYIIDEDFADILKVLPASELYTIKNAGHWVHVDHPDELFKKIIDFLRD